MLEVSYAESIKQLFSSKFYILWAMIWSIVEDFATEGNFDVWTLNLVIPWDTFGEIIWIGIEFRMSSKFISNITKVIDKWKKVPNIIMNIKALRAKLELRISVWSPRLWKSLLLYISFVFILRRFTWLFIWTNQNITHLHRLTISIANKQLNESYNIKNDIRQLMWNRTHLTFAFD